MEVAINFEASICLYDLEKPVSINYRQSHHIVITYSSSIKIVEMD